MTKKLLLILNLMILCTTIVSANSMPIYMSKYPSFNIAPIKDCPIEIEKEVLTFDIDEGNSTEAVVTAHYKMVNPTDEGIQLPMIFPFVFDDYKTNIASVTVNGKPIEFTVKRVGSLDELDYLKDKEAFIEAIQIEHIIQKMNEPVYQMQNFKEDAKVSVYSFDFKDEKEGRCEVSYDINSDKTMVVISGFNGYGQSTDGKCTASMSVTKNQKNASIIVLGEDTLENLEVTQGQEVNIEKSEVVLKDGITHQLIEPEKERYAIYDDEGMENAYGVVAEHIDELYNDGVRVLHNDEDILYSLNHKQNLSVMLYEVWFEPNSALNLEVKYVTNATIDRENSVDFTNTFVYLINPAKGWANFKELDIVINMSHASPYIIESSLPLIMQDHGRYTASIKGLPEDDLIFTTYEREEITFLDRTKGKLFKNYLSTFLLFVVVGAILIGGIIYLIIKKVKR